MIDIHKSEKDFHSCVALRAMTGKPINEITFKEIKSLDKAIRYRYKWTNWTLLFGGGAETLHHLYDMPYDEANQMVADYFEAFPEVKQFQDSCVAQAENFGYIESPYGRREHLYYINDYDVKKRNGDRRAAMNMPVQSGASDTVLIALVIVADKLSYIGSQAKLVNTVHDSIVLDVPKKEILPVATLVKDVMENVKTYAKDYMPDIDMSWLKCPLKADVDVGSHYGALIDIEDWKALHA
jgi:DNA polymerase-1